MGKFRTIAKWKSCARWAERKPVEPTEEIEGALRKLLAQIEASRAAQQ